MVQNGRVKIETTALLDGGCETTLVSQELATLLGLQGPKVQMNLGTFHGQDPLLTVIVSRCKVSSLDSTVSFNIRRVLVVPMLQLTPRCIDWPVVKEEWENLKALDLKPYDWQGVGMFIGSNVPAALRQLRISPSPQEGGPDGILTPFGWTVQGTLEFKEGAGIHHPIRVNCVQEEEENEKEIQRHWQPDSVEKRNQEKQGSTVRDQIAMSVYKKSVRKMADGHYQLGLPFVPEDARLPNNRPDALRRLFATESRFRADPEFARRYTKSIETYVELGFARRLSKEELEGPPGRTWYLPHFLVESSNKPEKPRLVFDAASRYRGVCLNDVLHSGPVILANLHDLLVLFRENPIAVSMDVEKMFLQVRVREEDQPVFRFFWRRPGEGGPPIAYQMMVEVFGASSSPTSSAFVLHRTADDNPSYCDVAHRVKSNFYVDNFLDSFDSTAEAIATSRRLKELLALGGFNLGQLASSSKEVMKSFDRKDWARPTINIDLDDLPLERALGVLWRADTDEFCFELKSLAQVKTKRLLLAAIASIFDPLGLLACVTITPRILLQDVWRVGKDQGLVDTIVKKLGWDDPLPESLLHRWNSIAIDLQSLVKLKIPRSLRSTEFIPDCTEFQLHICCDASTTAYGAMVFLRLVTQDRREVRLVTAKGKVAPVKQMTIPRLELLAALMGAQLGSRVAKILRRPITSTTYWTDSSSVLYWIRSTATWYNPFIANRKERILELSTAKQWKYVPSKMNPADDISRGIRASELSPSHRFYCGGYLNQDERCFPTENPKAPSLQDLEIVRPVAVCSVRILSQAGKQECRQLTNDIQEATSIEQLKRSVATGSEDGRDVSPRELQDALERCIQVVQAAEFQSEMMALSRGRDLPPRSSLRKLTPYIDSRGILRVGGRLHHATLQESVKHPAILPNNSRFTRLVILNAHERCGHSQTERTLYEVRAEYWIIAGRRTVRKVLNSCMDCRRRNSQPVAPLMAPLPRDRLQPFLPTFTATGVDYFGPLYVTVRRSSEKRYGVLFTCLATRAVHIEIAKQLDVDSFLMAWRRFVAIRGSPSKAYSDNGTNLVAGEQELRVGIEQLVADRSLKQQLADRGVEWHFSPPSGPHFGGIWERMVRSAKTALRVTSGKVS